MTLQFDGCLILFKHNGLHDSSHLSATLAYTVLCFSERTKRKSLLM